MSRQDDSRRLLSWLSILLITAVGIGCDSAPETGLVQGCEAKENARPICLFQNPEDLVALPGGQAILVSEYGAMEGNKPGWLSVFDLETEQRRTLFRGGDADDIEPSWGDDACPGPPSPAFSPHGIHLGRRPDGALQLLVVQHGGRESIEFFEVEGEGAEVELTWRGCVVAPDKTWLNSVAAFPDGGFVTTNMMERSSPDMDLAVAFESGAASGYALTWSPDTGFAKLAGSQGAMPNGVEVSPDGRLIFLNSSGESEVRRIERATGVVQARASVVGLDNARWASDGRLVVASVQGGSSEDFSLCMSVDVGACPIEFEIVAIDPETMETEVLYHNQGPPMGGGTVGLVIGDELFVGSFAGDRILRIAL